MKIQLISMKVNIYFLIEKNVGINISVRKHISEETGCFDLD